MRALDEAFVIKNCLFGLSSNLFGLVNDCCHFQPKFVS
jgi:hypothetical protein